MNYYREISDRYCDRREGDEYGFERGDEEDLGGIFKEVQKP
jgi:hypothetical protein